MLLYTCNYGIVFIVIKKKNLNVNVKVSGHNGSYLLVADSGQWGRAPCARREAQPVRP